MGIKTPPHPSYPAWTEARFWGFIRSALRSASMRWPPSRIVKTLNRRPYTGEGRAKWEYQCNRCSHWFFDKNTEVHHKIEVGQLKRYEDLPLFVERLFCPVEGYEILCKGCHN